MGRRWVVELLDALNPENGYVHKDGVYLRRYESFQENVHNKLVPELRPVTIPYATKFKTKREATDLAIARGWENYKVTRTWW